MKAITAIVALAALSATFVGGVAHAHHASPTTVFFDLGVRNASVEMQIPMDQLAMATERSEDELLRDAAFLRRYVSEHFRVSSNGQAWPMRIEDTSFDMVEGEFHLLVHAALELPANASDFHVEDDVVLHRVVSHRILLLVRNDFQRAHVDGSPELVGVLRYLRTSADVEREGGSWSHGAAHFFDHGMSHIAEGTDHMLFLLALLFPLFFMIAHARYAPAARISLASLVSVAALMWLGERAFGLSTPIETYNAFVVAHGMWLLAVATLVVAVARAGGIAVGSPRQSKAV